MFAITQKLDHGRTVIHIPGLDKEGWSTENRKKKGERVVTLIKEATRTGYRLTLTGHDELDLDECSVSATREKDQLIVFVKQIERVKKEGSGEIDFILESIESGMEPETTEEEPEPITEAEESPNPEPEKPEDLPAPAIVYETVPEVLPAEKPREVHEESSKAVAMAGVSVDIHLHESEKDEATNVTDKDDEPEPEITDEVSEETTEASEEAEEESPQDEETAQEAEPKPEKLEPLEVVAAPPKRPQPLSTQGPVTMLPSKSKPASPVEERPRELSGPPPAGAPGSFTERYARLQEEHERKLAEEALKRRKRANRDARKRERQAARAKWWKEWREARETRRRERPVRIGPSPAFWIGITTIAVVLALLVAGTFGVVALIANSNDGHHGPVNTEDPPNDTDPPVNTPPPEDTDPPVNTPPPDEQEPPEEPEPTNTPVEVAPGHIEIILPDGNEWSVAVNTGEEYMQEYTFECSKPDVELKIGNGQVVWADDEQPPVHGPFKFRGPENTSDIKCSIKW